jgi:hypothetical protein
MNKGVSKLIPIIAVIFILAAGGAFYAAFIRAQQLVSVVVAKQNIAAYTLVNGSEIGSVGVSKSSVTANNIKWSTYEQKYVHAHKPFITTLQVLAGDRLDSREVAPSGQSSFDVVSPDERVIAVTTSIVGAGLGTINAGDVVDVEENGGNGGSGGAGTTFAKVICIAASAAGCAGVLPPGVTLSVSSSGSSSTTSSNLVYVLLSVYTNDAAALAGQQVSLDLNPFCVFGSTASNVTPAQFVSARPKGPACQAPSNRDATTGGTGAVVSSG